MANKIGKCIVVGLLVLVHCDLWLGSRSTAAEPPALARLSGSEKERVAKLIEGAKKDGELVGYSAKLHPDLQGKILPIFREQYGLRESDLKINIVSVRTGIVVTKVTQELRAKVYKTDLINTAPAFWFDELIAKGEIMAYDCPEYKYFSPLVADPRVGQANPPYYISAMSSAQALSYNPKYVKGEIVHWKDVLRPEYEGQLSCGDVTVSFSLAEAYLSVRKVVGKSFFEELGKRKPFLAAAVTDRVAKGVSGEFPILVLSSQGIVFRAIERGAEFRLVFPPEGWALTGYPIAILAHAPHPNAAKLFMDFLHGEICQNLLLNFGGDVVGRLGLKSKYDIFPKPLEDLKGAIKMDWRKVTKQDREEAREEFRTLFKGTK